MAELALMLLPADKFNIKLTRNYLALAKLAALLDLKLYQL